MSKSPSEPILLTSVPTESEAIMIVGALETVGIKAVTVGGLTSAFRAEVPGLVHVLVNPADLDRAREILCEIESEAEDDSENEGIRS